jgi:hypothetical protein
MPARVHKAPKRKTRAKSKSVPASSAPTQSEPVLAGQTASTRIEPDHIRAAQTIYFASVLEYLEAFQVAQHLLLANRAKKGAAPLIAHYAKAAEHWLEQSDRRDLYTRALGIPGGGENAAVNEQFGVLWSRFIGAVAAVAAKGVPADLLSVQEIWQAARDLVRNLSQHIDAETLSAAQRLKRQAGEVVQFLSERETRSAFAAEDMWTLIEHVARHEWQGTSDTVTFRALATSAAIIFNWLAKNAYRLSRAFQRVAAKDLHMHPTDAELLIECSRWLALQVKPKAKRARKHPSP